MDYDILLQIFRYFCRFVPAEVLRKMAVTPDYAAMPGASEVAQEAASHDASVVISDIDAYIFSANPDFVSDKTRNSQTTVLFVEYGESAFKMSDTSYTIDLAVTIAAPYSKNNRDNIGEVLTFNKMLNNAISVIKDMEAYNEADSNCGKFSVTASIHPVEPKSFYDRVGITIFTKYTCNVLKRAGSFNVSFNKSFEV
ncbi:MAG: hypothetical protein IJR06_04400 [Paludibacteraceae bacterium]|nr:hypothetical protein [Paludibacteraceae bacterium]